ncbi:hypothetical protein [Guptibacillus algicola]|uniref:hypothetical protein n=1 Tax=Guptibacillus algicola TaxID=225844 RepID=UPI001CD66971|nr:hypothetical protein [Alkalihalobacillus algicola]MCA0986229.1 hypothetical protein [Alkalihalobacillus algicola]
MGYLLALVGGSLLLLLLMVAPLGLSRIQKYVVAGMGLLLSLLLLVFKSIYPLPIAFVLVLLVAMVIMYVIWKKANYLLISSEGSKELLEDYYNRIEVAEEKILEPEDELVNSPSEIVDEEDEDLNLEEIDFEESEGAEKLEQSSEDNSEFEVSEEDTESLIELDNIEEHAEENRELDQDTYDDEYVEVLETVEVLEEADYETTKEPIDHADEQEQVKEALNETEETADDIEGIDFSLRLESVLEEAPSNDFEESEEELTVENIAEEDFEVSELEEEVKVDEDLESESGSDEDEDPQSSRSNDFESRLDNDSFDDSEEECDEISAEDNIRVETYDDDEDVLDPTDAEVNDSNDEEISDEVVEDQSEQIAGEMVALLREQASYLKNSGNRSAYVNVTEQLLDSHLTDDIYFAVAAEYRDFLIVQKEWAKLNTLLDEMEKRCEYPLLLEEIHYLKTRYKQK